MSDKPTSLERRLERERLARKQAEQLLEEFHQQRATAAREAYQPKSIFAAIVEKPLRLVLLLAVLVILYISISPFVRPLLF